MATMAEREVSAACQREQCYPDVLEDEENTSRLGWNVCYVVCGLSIREDKVLMVQESKMSCRGSWYLPAGRVDANETIKDAAKRETLEESGHEIEPLALIAVEFNTTQWIRFSFAGKVIGGKLKTFEDKESMQAQWLSADVDKLRKEVMLRASDCVEIIRLAREWHLLSEGERCTGGFISAPHTSSNMRLIVAYQHENNTIEVMVRNKPSGGSWLPSLPLHGHKSVSRAIDSTVKSVGYAAQYELVGVLSIEHLGKPAHVCDGILMTVLLKAIERTLTSTSFCQWVVLHGEDASSITNSLTNTYGCAKLLDLHKHYS